MRWLRWHLRLRSYVAEVLLTALLAGMIRAASRLGPDELESYLLNCAFLVLFAPFLLLAFVVFLVHILSAISPGPSGPSRARDPFDELRVDLDRLVALHRASLMRIDLRLFAFVRQSIGSPRVALDLPDPATVADLRRALAETYPALVPLIPSLRIAVDSEYVDDDRVIPPGAEVAAIPPVSGGSEARP